MKCLSSYYNSAPSYEAQRCAKTNPYETRALNSNSSISLNPHHLHHNCGFNVGNGMFQDLMPMGNNQQTNELHQSSVEGNQGGAQHRISNPLYGHRHLPATHLNEMIGKWERQNCPSSFNIQHTRNERQGFNEKAHVPMISTPPPEKLCNMDVDLLAQPHHFPSLSGNAYFNYQHYNYHHWQYSGSYVMNLWRSCF